MKQVVVVLTEKEAATLYYLAAESLSSNEDAKATLGSEPEIRTAYRAVDKLQQARRRAAS